MNRRYNLNMSSDYHLPFKDNSIYPSPAFVCHQYSSNWAEPNRSRETTNYVDEETTCPAEPECFQNCSPIPIIQKKLERKCIKHSILWLTSTHILQHKHNSNYSQRTLVFVLHLYKSSKFNSAQTFADLAASST